MKQGITIAVHCHNFQKRLSWMLSSIDQQILPPKIEFNLAYMADSGYPKTEDVVRIFNNVKIVENVHTDMNKFESRGIIRNKQIIQCETNWILFADTDMVYHPEFFSKLWQELQTNHKTADYMLTTGRWSNPIEPTNNLVDKYDYPCIIEDSYKQADTLEKIRRGNVGAGFFQLVNLEFAPHEGYYVDPENCRDWSWTHKLHKTKSDGQFRKRIGKKQKLPRWFSENQIHLNHNRDNQHGKHLTEQR